VLNKVKNGVFFVHYIQILPLEIGADATLLKQTAELGRLPVVNFAAGGVATPADAALMMQLGCDGVFVGSGIFKSGNAAKRTTAIVQATIAFSGPSYPSRMQHWPWGSHGWHQMWEHSLQ
jgi:pyridoxal biosynthesis lyase PdxS